MIRASIVLGLALLLVPTFGSSLTAEEAKPSRTIAMSGHGEMKAAPDLAVVALGMLNSAKTAREALDLNNKAMAAILAQLKSSGIADRDIQTSGFSVAPRYDYGENNSQPPRLVGYDVSNTLTIALRKLDLLGSILDQAVSEGSNQINGIQFSISEPQPLEDAARKLAFADAERKARLYSQAAGIRVGPVISVTEVEPAAVPIPFQAKAMRAEASGAVPVAQGEQTLAADVTVVWQIE